MVYRCIIALVGCALVPQFAAAQFTTFIPPRAKTTDSAKAAVVAQQKAQSDSALNMRVTNMKTWVDSAAGVAAPPASAADSLAARIAANDSATFRNGARAPATASALPLLAVLGGGALCLGALLLAAPPRRRNSA